LGRRATAKKNTQSIIAIPKWSMNPAILIKELTVIRSAHCVQTATVHQRRNDVKHVP